MYEIFKISRQKNEPPVESVQLVTAPREEGHFCTTHGRPCLMGFLSFFIYSSLFICFLCFCFGPAAKIPKKMEETRAPSNRNAI